MATPIPHRLITADEFFDLPDNGRRYELVDGQVEEVVPSAYESGRVGGKLCVKLGAHVEEHDLGEYGVSESGFQLRANPDSVRAPDVWFLRKNRLPNQAARRRFFRGAPTLAVEVISPSDRYSATLRKVMEYLNAGAEMVWVIDPEERTAVSHRAGREPVLIDEHGTLDGEDVVPGFQIELRSILPRPE